MRRDVTENAHTAADMIGELDLLGDCLNLVPNWLFCASVSSDGHAAATGHTWRDRARLSVDSSMPSTAACTKFRL